MSEPGSTQREREMIVEIEDLSRHFVVRRSVGRLRREKRVVRAVDGISFTVGKGECVGYIGANGFGEIYGDYGEIAVTNIGKTIATWGEGFSYTGPGGSWFNIQR